MHYPAAHAFGDAAPSRLPAAPTECNAYRDLETAPQGALVELASKPFSSAGLTPAAVELRPCPAAGSPANETDRRLLAATSTGDREAFSRCYFSYFPQLAKFFSHVVATSAPEVIENLIEETMFRVWHESGALSKEASVHVSIMRIAYKCGCERLSAYGQPHDPPPSPSARQLGRHGNLEPPWQSLHKHLAALPQAERAFIHLVYSGHSRKEVAEILDMSCASVDAHLASSRLALDHWARLEVGNAMAS